MTSDPVCDIVDRPVQAHPILTRSGPELSHQAPEFPLQVFLESF